MKSIKLLMVVGLMLQVGIGFARIDAEQGQNILNRIAEIKAKSDSKLIEAVKKGNLKDLESALKDPKVNIDDIGEESDMTALMYACRDGRKDMVVLLLDNGACPHIESGWGSNTAVREAVQRDHKEIVKLLLGKRDASARLSMGYALIEGAKKGDEDIVELLLDNDADLNVLGGCTPDTSNTALIEASGRGYKAIVIRLLDKGADLNVENNITSATALMAASSHGHKDIVMLLLDKGANPHIRHVMGLTASEIAKGNGHKEIAQLIDKAIKAK